MVNRSGNLVLKRNKEKGLDNGTGKIIKLIEFQYYVVIWERRNNSLTLNSQSN